MGFLDDIERIENAKKSFYNLLISQGVLINESIKLDEYPNLLENLLITINGNI